MDRIVLNSLPYEQRAAALTNARLQKRQGLATWERLVRFVSIFENVHGDLEHAGLTCGSRTNMPVGTFLPPSIIHSRNPILPACRTASASC